MSLYNVVDSIKTTDGTERQELIKCERIFSEPEKEFMLQNPIFVGLNKIIQSIDEDEFCENLNEMENYNFHNYGKILVVIIIIIMMSNIFLIFSFSM